MNYQAGWILVTRYSQLNLIARTVSKNISNDVRKVLVLDISVAFVR